MLHNIDGEFMHVRRRLFTTTKKLSSMSCIPFKMVHKISPKGSNFFKWKTFCMTLCKTTYRTRAKISRAYSKLMRFLDALILEYFRKILIFEPCLFKICNNFEALFFNLIFWQISMYSRYLYCSNIPLDYTVMLWYLQLYLRNNLSIFSKF